MFYPKAGPSLQAEKPRLQFCRRHVFHRKLRNQGCCFARDLIGAVASRCFPHRTLSVTSEKTLRSEKIPGAPTRRWGQWIWLTGSSGFHRNSPQGLNISSIRVFDQMRDPKIPIKICRPFFLFHLPLFSKCGRTRFECFCSHHRVSLRLCAEWWGCW